MKFQKSHTYAPLLALAFACLAACGSTPSARNHSILQAADFDPAKDPYWQDPIWAKRLLDAVQSAVQDPVDPSDMSTPGLNAVVKFTYASGNIQYPEIVQGTGDPAMDKLLIQQVASAQVPQATGLRADEPHEFALQLEMPTPFESFEYGVFAALDAWRVYPKEAVFAGDQGSTTVSFDYLDGKVSSVAVTKSSGSRYLDKASIDTVTKARLPGPPSIYAGKVIHLKPSFCYSLIGSGKCPIRRGVILTYGTRVR